MVGFRLTRHCPGPDPSWHTTPYHKSDGLAVVTVGNGRISKFLARPFTLAHSVPPDLVLDRPPSHAPPPQIIVFNRVRSMTSDYTLLIEAMRRSSELEIMEQVRRGALAFTWLLS